MPKPPVWPRFLAAHALLVEKVEARLAAAGLPPLGWYDVLWGLEQAPGRRLRMSELADAVVLTRSNLTRLVDRLEDAKLVRRQRVSEDGRGAFAALTERGAAQRKAMWPVYRAAIDELFERHLGEAEAEALHAALGRVLAAARG